MLLIARLIWNIALLNGISNQDLGNDIALLNGNQDLGNDNVGTSAHAGVRSRVRECAAICYIIFLFVGNVVHYVSLVWLGVCVTD